MTLPSLIPGRPRAGITPVRGTLPIPLSLTPGFAGRVGGPVDTLLGAAVPEQLRYRTLVLQGAQGCGKTLTLFDSLLPRLRLLADPAHNERLILVDMKGDITRLVLGARRVLCPNAPVTFLNPFERFGSAPDPAEFADDPARIRQLVQALSFRQRDARTDDFFDNTARNHLALLVRLLRTKAPGLWDWRTFYHLATDIDLHRRVLRASRAGRGKPAPKVQRMFAGVVGTIESWLGAYEPAFACWSKSPTFRLNDFLRGRGILVVACPEDQREAFAPVLRTVLSIARDRLLADTGRDPRSFTTLVLDEFADFQGLVPILMPFFGKSRSANVAIVAAWQSWPAACEAHGEGAMKGLIDNAAVRLYFQCGRESAEVAARDCLSAEVSRGEWSYGYKAGDGLAPGLLDPQSATLSLRVVDRPNVLAGEIAALGVPGDADRTVRAYLRATHLPGPVLCEQDYGPLIEFCKRLPKVPAFRDRRPEDKWLADWDDDTDGRRLAPLFEPDPGLEEDGPDEFTFQEHPDGDAL